MARYKNEGDNKNDNEIFSYSPEGKRAEKRMRRKKFPLKGFLLILLSALMLVGGAGLITFYSIIENIGYIPTVEKEEEDTSNVSSNTESELNFGELLNDPMVLNVMIFGEDKREAGAEHGRSDTMLLLSVDNRRGKLKITSFMRDMLVTIPETDDAGQPIGRNKLNAAYTLGGPALSVKTIETNFGIEIDRYAIVNFDSFREIIDVLGGIDLELTQEEIDYINWQTYINKESDERYELKDEAPPASEDDEDEPTVKVHLEGRQALWYARNRGYEDENHPEFAVKGDDFDRTSRQRTLMNQVLKDFKKANLTQIVQIVSEIGPMIETNLKTDEITMLVSNSLTYLGYDSDEFRVPTDDNYTYRWYDPYTDEISTDSFVNAQSVILVPDWEAARLSLAEFIYEDSLKQNEFSASSNELME